MPIATQRCAARSLFKHAVLRYLSAGKTHLRILVKNSITYTSVTASTHFPGRGPAPPVPCYDAVQEMRRNRVRAGLAPALEHHPLLLSISSLPVALRLAILLVQVIVCTFDALFHAGAVFSSVRVCVGNIFILLRWPSAACRGL